MRKVSWQDEPYLNIYFNAIRSNKISNHPILNIEKTNGNKSEMNY